jgi:hypothetical protein
MKQTPQMQKQHRGHQPILLNGNTFEEMLDIDMFMKFAPASVATAFASIVFPVPGGPNSNIPLHG